MGDVRARPGWIVLVCALLLVLCGCTMTDAPHEAERSSKQVDTELKAIPGVVSVDLNGGSSGMPGRDSIGAGLSVVADYAPDSSALLDYVLAELWSQTSINPTTVVTVSLDKGGDIVDLATAGTALGLTDVGTRSFAVSASEMAERYGAWPGPVPTLPAALAVG